MPENVTNTYVGAASEAGDDEPNADGEVPTETPGRASISGTFNYISMTNTGKAWVGKNAQINTNASYATPNRTFDSRNLLDPAGLAATLVAHADVPSAYVWSKFSQSDQSTLASLTATDAQKQAVLLAGLNTLVNRFFDFRRDRRIFPVELPPGQGS